MVSVRDNPTEKEWWGAMDTIASQDTIALRSVVCGVVLLSVRFF